jgi:hypothetical protein
MSILTLLRVVTAGFVKEGRLFTSWATVCFSRILLHEFKKLNLRTDKMFILSFVLY